jgi:hypothetical protein
MKNHVLKGGKDKPSKAPLNRHRIKALKFLFFGSRFNIIAVYRKLLKQAN